MTRIPLTGYPEIDRLLIEGAVGLLRLYPWVRRGIERSQRRWRRKVDATRRNARRRVQAAKRRAAAVLDHVCTVD